MFYLRSEHFCVNYTYFQEWGFKDLRPPETETDLNEKSLKEFLQAEQKLSQMETGKSREQQKG